jgi:hypothetical protein
MQASLNRLMRKMNATISVGPCIPNAFRQNQAFNWIARFEWGDESVQVSGVTPEAALQGLTVVVTAKFDEEESELDRRLRSSESRHGA